MKRPTAEQLKEWLWRYGPAEVISLAATLAASLLALRLSRDRTVMALAGTWGGNIGYFGTILFRDMLHTRRQLRDEGRIYTRRTFGRNVKALLIEFGVAEVFDTLLIRPLLLYALPLLLQDMVWGLIAGKLIADITFYLPAIFFYEWGKRRFRNF